MDNVNRLGEEGIIDLFDPGSVRAPIVEGIGDDCAVIENGTDDYLLCTTDLLIEGTHFRRDFTGPEDLGSKSLAVNFSDIAAMGGTPTGALLSLALPRDLGAGWVRAFRDGLREIADCFACQIVGGDTCRSESGIFISVTVFGSVRRDELLLRRGAAHGDDLWLAGVPGCSGYGLKLLMQGIRDGDAAVTAALRRHRRPTPMLELGRTLAAAHLATACLDTSDGIAIDAARLGLASGVGVLIDTENVPLPQISPLMPADPLALALHGGEDYGLLFTARPAQRRQIEQIAETARIGGIDGSFRGVRLRGADGSVTNLEPAGFSHFG